MVDSNYLAAFTPGQEAREAGEYRFYPPFVNFTQIGDRVRVTVRSTDEQMEGKPDGWYRTKAYADMELPVEDFRKLLEQALSNLRVDA